MPHHPDDGGDRDLRDARRRGRAIYRLRVRALAERRARGRDLTAADIRAALRREPGLAVEQDEDDGTFIRVVMDGRALVTLAPSGELAWFDGTAVYETPRRESAEFERGMARTRASIDFVAARRRVALRHGHEGRTRRASARTRPRSRARRSPRVSRAGPDDGDAEPGEARPDLIGGAR